MNRLILRQQIVARYFSSSKTRLQQQTSGNNDTSKNGGLGPRLDVARDGWTFFHRKKDDLQIAVFVSAIAGALLSGLYYVINAQSLHKAVTLEKAKIEEGNLEFKEAIGKLEKVLEFERARFESAKKEMKDDLEKAKEDLDKARLEFKHELLSTLAKVEEERSRLDERVVLSDQRLETRTLWGTSIASGIVAAMVYLYAKN
jgi:hypothetical protein